MCPRVVVDRALAAEDERAKDISVKLSVGGLQEQSLEEQVNSILEDPPAVLIGTQKRINMMFSRLPVRQSGPVELRCCV